MNNIELIKFAKSALLNAYAPYSGYCVGSALLTKSGKVYTGCNIENAAFSPTNCAERTAFFKAISEGERAFEKIAIISQKDGKIDNNVSPCGVCRQVMREFCDEKFSIIIATSDDTYNTYTLNELLPYSFSVDNIGGKL